MSQDTILRARELLVLTQDVLEALRAGLPETEFDALLERQRDAFSDFSRLGDTAIPLDQITQQDVDAVLGLEELIVNFLHDKGEALMRESRGITRSKNLAQAFFPKSQDPPRFIAQRV